MRDKKNGLFIGSSWHQYVEMDDEKNTFSLAYFSMCYMLCANIVGVSHECLAVYMLITILSNELETYILQKSMYSVTLYDFDTLI